MLALTFCEMISSKWIMKHGKAKDDRHSFSRNGKSFTARFASIAHALEALPDDTVIGGQIIAYDADVRALAG
jgi:ATP-dependent DNA ligase